VVLSADGRLVACGSFDGTVRLWEASSGAHLHTLRCDRRYERVDVTGLTGVTAAQRVSLLALGAIRARSSYGSERQRAVEPFLSRSTGGD
jgi:WD40 repeat protein